MKPAFDTLRYARTLEDAGVSPRQTQAHVRAVEGALQDSYEQLATKQDVLLVKQDVLLMKQDILIVKQELMKEILRNDAHIQVVDSKLEGFKDVVLAKFDGLQKQMDMMKWFMGGILTSVLLLLIKAFIPSTF